MKNNFLSVNKCRNGSVLAEDIINNNGVTIIAKDTIINDYIKVKLTQMRINHVWVHNLENNPQLTTNFQEAFIMKYNENISTLKKIIIELAQGNSLDTKSLQSLVNAFYNELQNKDSIIKCLSDIKSVDEYTYSHSINVALYAMLIAGWLKLPEKQIQDIIQAGLLHDIGKIKVSLEILNKPSRLLPHEFDEMKKHTLYGYDIVKALKKLSEEVQEAILNHHEREDKSGYPNGINGDKICLYSKIIAVADVYDAMTSDRIYKSKSTPFNAFEMFQTSGLKCFDVKVTCKFLSNISSYYIGSKVQLTSGETGEIVFIPPQSISKPVVKVGKKYIDFTRNCNIKITSFL